MTAENLADIGRVLTAYDLGAEIGRGSFGVVYAGRHRQLDREVAIKQLAPTLVAEPGVLQRFSTEARVLATLAHPHVVPIYDYVERDGVCLLVMEYLSGGTIWDRFASRGINRESACAIVMAVCAALSHAHSHGVLHRDIKPENLLVSADHAVKVTDFGIAQVLGGADTLATQSGEILGSPAYMAPEQARGGDIGVEADVFSVGVVLHELLTGRLPYGEEDAIRATAAHVEDARATLSALSPALDAQLVDATMRAISPDASARYSSAEEFGVAIGRAATASFAAQWMSRAEFPLMSAGPILDSAQSARTGGRHMPTIARTGPIGGATQAPEGETAEAHRRAQQRDFRAVEHADLVTVRAPTTTASSRWLLVASLLLLVVSLVIAWIGVGSVGRTWNGEFSDTTVNNTRLEEGVTIDNVDLANEIALDHLPADTGNVTLSLSAGGNEIGSGTQEIEDNAADVKLSSARFLVAGETTAELTAGDRSTEFGLTPKHFGLLTVPGVLGVGLLLFVIAYIESLVRPLRRGRARRVLLPLVALGALGALAGPAIVTVAWSIGGAEPRLATVVVCGFVTAASAVVFGVAAARRRAPVARAVGTPSSRAR